MSKRLTSIWSSAGNIKRCAEGLADNIEIILSLKESSLRIDVNYRSEKIEDIKEAVTEINRMAQAMEEV